MKESTGKRRSAWFWVGVTLLTSSALLWLFILPMILYEPEETTTIVGGLLLITVVPIGIGVYCVRRGRKAPAAEMQQSTEPTYASQTVVPPIRETQRTPGPAYASHPSVKPVQTYKGLFNRLKEKLGDKTMAKKINLQLIEEADISELSYFLDLMGIRSEIGPPLDFVVDDPKRRFMGPELLNVRGRHFKLEGMNIDGMCYTIEQLIVLGPSDWAVTDKWEAKCEYWVKRDVSGDKKHLKARTKKKKKGLFGGDIIDFKWVGGRIADILNQDTSLKEPLLADLVTAQTKGSDATIEIEPIPLPREKDIMRGYKRLIKSDYYFASAEDAVKSMMPIGQGVWIRVSSKILVDNGVQKNVPLLLPSKDAFRAYDRVAKHIKDYTIL